MAERKENIISAPTPSLPLAISTSFEYSKYDVDTKQVTAMVELKAVDLYNILQHETKLPANDIVLVLDVSGSMEEDNKLRMMKKTAEHLIRSLPIGNSLAVVTFDDYVKTIIPLTCMPEHDTLAKRQELINVIQRISANGNTNLCGALLEALDILGNSKAPPHAQQMVILLTDGHATAGIKDAANIQSLVGKKFEKHKAIRNVKLHTIGLGESQNLNRKLLENLAIPCNGTFFLIQTPDRIPSCLGDCMGSLMSMVAANIELSIVIPPNIQLTSCGLPPKETAPTKLVWSFQDILLGESRNLLLGARNITPGKPVIEQFRIDYVDVILGRSCSTTLPGVIVPKAMNNEDIKGSAIPNPEIQVHMMRVMVAAAMEEKKIQSLQMYKTLLQTADAAVAKHPISIQLLADIEAALTAKVDVALRAQSLVRQRTCQFVEEHDQLNLDQSLGDSPFTTHSRRNYQVQYTQECTQDEEEESPSLDMLATQLPPPPITDEELDAMISSLPEEDVQI